MNANELADELKDMCIALSVEEHWVPVLSESATMLRQQQAKLTKYELRHAEQRKRIDELEKQLAFMEGEYPEPTIMAKMMEVDLVRQQQAEIEALRWQVGILKEDVAAWMDDAQGWHPDDRYFERLFNERK